jgi:hypothetical protein
VRERKTFLMNGVQTCLAVLAWRSQLDRSTIEHMPLSDHLDAVPGHLDALMDEYALALALSEVCALTNSEVLHYRDWYRGRILASAYGDADRPGDRVDRILSRYAPGRPGPAGVDDMSKKMLRALSLLRSYDAKLADESQIQVVVNYTFKLFTHGVDSA